MSREQNRAEQIALAIALSVERGATYQWRLSALIMDVCSRRVRS